MGKVHEAEVVSAGGSKSRALARRPQRGVLAKKGAINFEKLLSTALESGASLDTMERVLAMRRELRAEAAEEAFTEALNRFQALCPILDKPKAVKNTKGDSKGTVRYSYAPLDYIVRKIKPLLKKCGFSYKLSAKVPDGGRLFVIVFELRHIAGHKEISEFPIPVNDSEYMTLLQNFGSSNSFAKRYALCNALGIMTGDEDNDGANGTPGEGTKSGSQAQERRRPQARPDSSSSSAPAKKFFTQGPAEKIGASTEKTIREMMRRGALTDSDLLKRFNIMSVSDIPAKEVQLVLDWIKDPVNK